VRLFVAVWPPDDILDDLARLPRPDRPGVRWTTRDQWHVTLRFLGQIDEIEGIKDALAAVGGLGVQTASAGPVTTRLGSSIICLPVAGLERVAAMVLQSTAGFGAPPPDRPFHGHLTLARGKRGARVGGLAGEAFEASWSVDQVTLVASRLHPGGARYEVVERFPLDG
jgi:2'-5' RNA ligase